MKNTENITQAGSIAEIWECPNTGNKSLHSTTEFKSGQIISDFGYKEILEQPNYLTVQIGDRQHIMLTPEYFQSTNHSCDPNVLFDTENMKVIALKDIEISEELTFFYPSTEWSMAQTFNCLCQSKNCLKTIKGAADLPLEILTKYKLSKYIQQKLKL